MDLTTGIDVTSLDTTRDARYFDEDGYPTTAALELIKNWHYDDPNGWVVFIHSVWYLRQFGFHAEQCINTHWSGNELKATRLYLSTAGWSGNEAIIRAMQCHNILWDDMWQSSRRGGHHVFELVWEDIPQ